MVTRRTPLGEILIREGKLSEPALAEALAAQGVLGGRIGTNLVELELISIQELGWYLALQLRVPEASPELFLASDPRLLERFPRELAGRLQVFPLRLEDRVLHLAMVAPADLQQLDEVSFATGQRVKPYVAPELRMLFFLEQRYGFARDPRFLRVEAPGELEPAGATEEPRAVAPPKLGEITIGVESASRRGDPTGPFAPGRPLTPVRGAPATRTGPLTPPRGAPALSVPPPVVTATPVQPLRIAASSPPPREPTTEDEISEADLGLVFLDDVRASRAGPDEDDFEVTLVEPEEPAAKPAFAALAAATSPQQLDDLFADEPEPPRSPPAPSSPPPDLMAELTAQLERATSKDEVAATLLRAGSDRPSVAVLFLVRGDSATALAARGSTLPAEEVARLLLPLPASPLFRAATEQGRPARGSALEDPMQQVISGFLRAPAAEEACVAPVMLARRAVNILCVQSPHPARLPAGIEEALAELCARAAAAYGRLIRELKRRG